MNILHELNQCDVGGVERVIRNIVKFDKENTHRIAAYKNGSYKQELERAGAEVHIAPQGKESDISIAADIIHIHTGGALSEMAREIGGNVPVVETIHSPVRSPNLDKHISQRVGVTDIVSKMNAGCVTIHNGIDFDDLKITRPSAEIKKELGIPEGKPIVGRLGRLGHDKGIEDWMLACYELQRSGLDFVPLIVGGEARDHDGYRGMLKLMAESLPVRGVVWAGHRNDVANLYQIMDVFLYPSPTEGFGLVFAEAMYCGPVVVTVNNLVALEVAGGYAILTGGDIRSLKDGVIAALDKSMQDAIPPMAREFVEEEYDARRMSRDYQELYSRVALEHKLVADGAQAEAAA